MKTKKAEISKTQLRKFFQLTHSKNLRFADWAPLLEEFNLPTNLSLLSLEDLKILKGLIIKPLTIGSKVNTTAAFAENFHFPFKPIVNGTVEEINQSDKSNAKGRQITVRYNVFDIQTLNESWLKEGNPFIKKYGSGRKTNR